MPVGLLIRQVFEEAADFGDAVGRLSEAVIPCDCLLPVTGMLPDEMLVIERTPTRHAIRRARNGFVHATNDYRLIDPDTCGFLSALQSTSCGRFDRLNDLLVVNAVQTPEACLKVLSDPGVVMSITVQQMVFQATTGTSLWRSV
ncbi:C45 family peptidase [Halovulum sp. GXIMD14793]